LTPLSVYCSELITRWLDILVYVNDLTFPMQGSHDEPFNFVLLDGTWSNSAALYRRLKVQFVLATA
jgi:hypothetical protein